MAREITVKAKRQMALDQTVSFAFLWRESLKVFNLAEKTWIFERTDLIPPITSLQYMTKRGSPGLRNMQKDQGLVASLHSTLKSDRYRFAKKNNLYVQTVIT